MRVPTVWRKQAKIKTRKSFSLQKSVRFSPLFCHSSFKSWRFIAFVHGRFGRNKPLRPSGAESRGINPSLRLPPLASVARPSSLTFPVEPSARLAPTTAVSLHNNNLFASTSLQSIHAQATAKEIKAAYSKHALVYGTFFRSCHFPTTRFHPDKLTNDSIIQQSFHLLTRARNTLQDPYLREVYDTFGEKVRDASVKDFHTLTVGSSSR